MLLWKSDFIDTTIAYSTDNEVSSRYISLPKGWTGKWTRLVRERRLSTRAMCREGATSPSRGGSWAGPARPRLDPWRRQIIGPVVDRSLQFELLIQNFKPLKLLDCHGESIDCQSTSDGKSFKIRFDYWEERDIRNISHRKIMRDGAKVFTQVKIENQKLDWNVTAKVRLHNQYLTPTS